MELFSFIRRLHAILRTVFFNPNGEFVMNQKQRGSEKLQFTCGKTGVRSIEDFQQVEELLEARGGASVALQSWWIRGIPAVLNYGAINPVTNVPNVNVKTF